MLTDAGLLERFRDGQYVYFRLPLDRDDSAVARRMVELLPVDSAQLRRDWRRALDGGERQVPPAATGAPTRELNQALLEFAQVRPLGRLLDIGAGSGRVMSVLARQVTDAIGLDHDPAMRLLARQRLREAGLTNCSLRAGQMESLPFAADEFDTVIVDEVLGSAARPQPVIAEAVRVMREDGRLLIIVGADELGRPERAARQLAAWLNGSGLRLAPPRQLPATAPKHLFFCCRSPVGVTRRGWAGLREVIHVSYIIYTSSI